MRPTLAIEGGLPVRTAMLPYGRHSVDDQDIQAVVETLRSEWLTTGPKVEELESAFAKSVGARFAVAVSSGTAALHAAAFAARITQADEVITTPLTFAATANCVRYMGGTVVFADVRRDILTLNHERVQELITEKTKAIITVDYAGQPSDLDELRALTSNYGLVLIDDASHALGANFRGRPVGALADLTTFSLHPVKHMTTGEGGVVTTDDPEMATRLRMFRTHGITTDFHQREREGAWNYEMVELGFNYRLTDIQCALGLSQLNKLEGWVARRREIAKQYNAEFSKLAEIETPTILPDRQSAWHLYVIRVHPESLRVGRGELFRALRVENIGVNVHYIPVPWHPYYQKLGYEKGKWPVAEEAYEQMITLPLFPTMKDQDVEDVIMAVKKVVSFFRK